MLAFPSIRIPFGSLLVKSTSCLRRIWLQVNMLDLDDPLMTFPIEKRSEEQWRPFLFEIAFKAFDNIILRDTQRPIAFSQCHPESIN